LDDLKTEYDLEGGPVVRKKKNADENVPFKLIEEKEDPVFEINFNPQAFRKEIPDFVS